ncbi:MAG: arylsulfatase [Proteobacteria bacterium]|nr:arylsulfatase [Pseudomonadota bacterium]
MFRNLWLVMGMGLLLLGCSAEESAKEPTQKIFATEVPAKRPNFLLITTDDMGYTDFGAFGGRDIPTPNFDGLAMESVRLSNFHVSTVCSPTRSMLMSGTGNHEAGKGQQRVFEEFLGNPGYEGTIVDRIATMPERLAAAGYHTYMAGKWHLGNETGTNLPGDRGFERSFALAQGSYDHFDPMLGESVYTEDGQMIVDLPDNFYSTTVYVDKIISYLQSNESDGEPFFAWLAPTAPHWPLQVLPEWMGRFAGIYDAGYDALCVARQQGAMEAGVLPEGADTSICPEETVPWAELSEDERKLNSRAMELYASMVAHLDSEFGRLFTYLRESGQLENTYVIYHNDNGPDGGEIFDERSEPERFNNSFDNLGNRDSWMAVGQGWADAQSAPFRGSKGSQFEGGTRVSAFIRPLNPGESGRISDSLLTVMDVLPTIMDLAGIEESTVNATGSAVLPIRGKSFASLLTNTDQAIHQDEYIALDMGGDSVLMENNWRIVRPASANHWELFNMAVDPSETTDLSAEEPEMLADLVSKYEVHAQATGILRIDMDEE